MRRYAVPACRAESRNARESGLLQRRAFLLTQLLLLAQQFETLRFRHFRLAGALDGGGNLTVEKLIAQKGDHVHQLPVGIRKLAVLGDGLGDETPHSG